MAIYICDFCGREFYIIPSKLLDNKKHYCSKECSHKGNVIKSNLTKLKSNNNIQGKMSNLPKNITCDYTKQGRARYRANVCCKNGKSRHLLFLALKDVINMKKQAIKSLENIQNAQNN